VAVRRRDERGLRRLDCWHQGGSTDSYGLELRGFTGGLGWLPYSNGVHYDAEAQRRPTMHELIGDGTLGRYATDDGAGSFTAARSWSRSSRTGRGLSGTNWRGQRTAR